MSGITEAIEMRELNETDRCLHFISEVRILKRVQLEKLKFRIRVRICDRHRDEGEDSHCQG